MSLPSSLKVLLVDDEALARLRLRSLLEGCIDPRAEVVAEAGSASQAQVEEPAHAARVTARFELLPDAAGRVLPEVQARSRHRASAGVAPATERTTTNTGALRAMASFWP